MIALVYLAVAVFLGDALASRWFRPVTWFHRLAAAFLIGLLIATWVTYLTSLLFDGRVDGRPVFTCIITYVGVKLGTRETMPPPAEVRSLLGG